jgi:hypothetical protein
MPSPNSLWQERKNGAVRGIAPMIPTTTATSLTAVELGEIAKHLLQASRLPVHNWLVAKSQLSLMLMLAGAWIGTAPTAQETIPISRSVVTESNVPVPARNPPATLCGQFRTRRLFSDHRIDGNDQGCNALYMQADRQTADDGLPRRMTG